MCDCMTFADTVEEYMEQYKIVDTERVYTNGAELVPIFRMKQWFEHLPSADVQPVRHGHWEYNDSEQFEELYVDTMRCTNCGECVDGEIHIREYAIELEYKYCPNCGARMDEGGN